MRIATLRIHVALCPRHEDASRLMQPVEALKADVASIHDVGGAGFRNQLIEDVDVVKLAIADMDKTRDIAAMPIRRCAKSA